MTQLARFSRARLCQRSRSCCIAHGDTHRRRGRYSWRAVSPDIDRTRTLRGAVSGAVAAAVWGVQQPLDKRVFSSRYDDIELLGKAVTRGDAWYAFGLGLHIGNGALFGAIYACLL